MRCTTFVMSYTNMVAVFVPEYGLQDDDIIRGNGCRRDWDKKRMKTQTFQIWDRDLKKRKERAAASNVKLEYL